MNMRGLVYRFQQEADGTIHKLYLYDTVTKYGDFNWHSWEYEDSETSAKYFRDALDDIPDDHEIHLHINSMGGEVGEGVAIYNLLRQKSQQGCNIVAYIDGMAYSVAADIAMAADELHMGLGTSMLLHFPWMYTVGNAEQLRQAADQLDALGEASVQLYLSRAKNLTAEELREMMRKETVLDPETCLQYGFCDVVDEYKADPEKMSAQQNAVDAALLQKLQRELMEAREQVGAQLAINQAILNLQGKDNQEPAPQPEPKRVYTTLLKAMRLADAQAERRA